MEGPCGVSSMLDDMIRRRAEVVAVEPAGCERRDDGGEITVRERPVRSGPRRFSEDGHELIATDCLYRRGRRTIPAERRIVQGLKRRVSRFGGIEGIFLDHIAAVIGEAVAIGWTLCIEAERILGHEVVLLDVAAAVERVLREPRPEDVARLKFSGGQGLRTPDEPQQLPPKAFGRATPSFSRILFDDFLHRHEAHATGRET